ncbi:MAG TPA: 30S ribosomal protein S3 [Candidatus Acidoferrales bacterium]|nr:30S ribosomal protein S3 [Candidatus Acidoferrales bacterium]
MGQKTNPIGFRLGITRDWDSTWFERKGYSKLLGEDEKVRSYLRSRLDKAGVSRVSIERKGSQMTVSIHTSRPGIVIGKSGKDVNQLEAELKKLTKREAVKIKTFEIKRPELDAYLVAENIATQIEGRINFRRAMKNAITSATRMGAEGIRVMCAGRLGGAEIARTEQYREGRVPLHTLRADIDYASLAARTIYGLIGVKVWICRGEVYGPLPR